MTPSEREQMERLNRYWDESTGGAAETPQGFDPALMNTVRQLRALHRPPAIDPAFQRQLEERLLGVPVTPSSLPGSRRLRPSGPAAPPSLNGHATGRPWAVTVAKPDRRRWQPGQLAAAAVLALAVIGSLLVVRFAGREPERAQNTLDAAHRPAVETLVDAAVENPDTAWTPLSVERWTFEPGDAVLTIAPVPGPQWIVGEGSGLRLTIDGIERDLPPGTGVSVAAGRELTLRNSGTEPTTALRGIAAAEFVFEDYPRAAISKQTALDTEAHEALPPGPSRVVFERLTLLAGTMLLLEPASGQDWLTVSSGDLGLTLLGDGLPLSWQSGREREIAAGESLPTLVPGTRVTLRNIGEEPLVLLRLRVLPVEADDAGGAIDDGE